MSSSKGLGTKSNRDASIGGLKWRVAVKTDFDRAAIPLSPGDEGMAVFVEDTGCSWAVVEAAPGVMTWVLFSGTNGYTDNPYYQYVEEKDPIENYEVFTYSEHLLGISFHFHTLPNMYYWNSVILPELRRIAAEHKQIVRITESSHYPLIIDIPPPTVVAVD